MTDAVSNQQAIQPPHTPNAAEDLIAIHDADVPNAPIDEQGVTTDVPVSYVSDAALLAWLQAKSSGKYGELDQMMDMSNARSQLVKDLSDLKATLTNEDIDPTAALEQIDALLTTYAGTEHEQELVELVAPLRAQVEGLKSTLDAITATPPADGVPVEAVMDGTSDAAGVEPPEEPEAPPPGTWGEASTKSWFVGVMEKSMGKIDAAIKDLEHDDQLALIQIQALMSEIRETSQLTSNIISNRSQTADAIVGNIRG